MKSVIGIMLLVVVAGAYFLENNFQVFSRGNFFGNGGPHDEGLPVIPLIFIGFVVVVGFMRRRRSQKAENAR